MIVEINDRYQAGKNKNKSSRDTNIINKNKSAVIKSTANSCHVREKSENDKSEYEMREKPRRNLFISTIGPLPKRSKEDEYILIKIDMSNNNTKLYILKNKNFQRFNN